jgi:hypothetical protein
MLEGKLGIAFVRTKEWRGWFVDAGVRFQVTIPGPHGGKPDLPPGTARWFQRQLRVNREDFLALLDCTMDREAYVAKLRALGLTASEE